MIKLSFDENNIEDFFRKSMIIRINITRIKILKMKIIFKFAIHAFSFICKFGRRNSRPSPCKMDCRSKTGK